ncbi:MAG: CRISPR-associated helicase Cas3' [Chloroflexota bacterium]
MAHRISDDDLIHMYTRQGRGYTDQELADHFNVGRDAIFKRRQKLETKYPFKETERGRYRIDTNSIISHIPVKPAEALILYSFLRRSGRSTPFPKEHVKEALNKLAPALYKPMTEKLVQAAAGTLAHPDDAKREDILGKILVAWTEKRTIRVKYYALQRRDDPIWHIVSPYLIEPSPWSDSIYLVGYSSATETIIPLSLERIEKAVETSEPFRECDLEIEDQLLRHAWGIWGSNKKPEIVRLHFTGYQAVRRLRESVWHPEQQVDGPDDYSYATWEAPIAEWREMLPWIRGWGADCEVIEPEELREELVKETRRLMQIYQLGSATALPAYLLPYAKTNPDKEGEVHRLLYHLIDVGQVTLALWQAALTDSIRQRLARMLNLSLDEAGRFLAFLAALHDLGKAVPGYQKKYGPPWLKEELKKAGLDLEGGTGKAYDKTFPHGTVSTWVLMSLLPEIIGLDKAFAYQIAVAIGGHHGSWPAPDATDRLGRDSDRWDTVRRDLFREVQAVFQPPAAVSPPTGKTELNTWLTLLSGLVSVADWVGSRNKESFGFVEQALPTHQYAARSVQKAQKALGDLGWLGWQPTGQVHTFAEVFAYLNFATPHGVQARVIKAAQNLQAPALLILEAPTGIGKTETALYLADSWLQQYAGRGLYVAMPTQATSNQMYERVGNFLNHRYPEMRLNYHLVHGQAAWQDELKNKVELQNIGDGTAARVLAESWFTPRKRTLLAPFGVGTVDQTLMSILQTRHFFVRLFGLSHKVIIFDEVHAYDTFMSTLFERLLAWLNAIGTSVIILSATLPAKTRQNLVESYTGKKLPETTAIYPIVTIAAPGSEPQVIELPKPEDVTLHLEWSVGREPLQIVDYLQTKLANGGCATVICNTVRRAQDVYRALDQARQNGTLDLAADDLILFHARFPPIWRQEIEQTVLAKFGKPEKDKPNLRPHKAIVVATQVIEQSLDLDFDLMLTDLAPIDLIIQRAGRLHRHPRSEQDRHGHTRRLVITEPDEKDQDGLPGFDNDEYVYAPYILLRSFYALKAKGHQITLPRDTTPLIEQVYGDLALLDNLSGPQLEAIKTVEREMNEADREAKQKAARQLILSPGKSRLLEQSITDLDEESPDIHTTLRVQTRDIDPGISLVCLHREDGQLFVHTPAGPLTVNLDEKPPFTQIKHLQQSTITVQHKAVFHHFLKKAPPPGWQKEAALRHCRALIFEQGVCPETPKYTLRLSPKFGLEIIKQEDI